MKNRALTNTQMETTSLEIIRIITEKGFTMHRLARAMHTQGRTRGPGTKLLNLWAADAPRPAAASRHAGHIKPQSSSADDVLAITRK